MPAIFRHAVYSFQKINVQINLENDMSNNKESFLLPMPQPWHGCNDPSPLPFVPPWPGDLIQVGLATRAAMRSVKYQLPAIMKLSPDAQESTIASIFEGLEQEGLLSAAEVESLRGVSKGKAFDAPLFNPDGSPSLCGVLGKFLAPSPERNLAGGIMGAAIGAAVGAGGGPAGAGAGAIVGGIIGHLLT